MTQPDTNANRLVGITAASNGKPTLHLRATVANCHLLVGGTRHQSQPGSSKKWPWFQQIQSSAGNLTADLTYSSLHRFSTRIQKREGADSGRNRHKVSIMVYLLRVTFRCLK